MRTREEIDLPASGNAWRFWPAIVLAILTFGACYEPIEGCLDIGATNFAVNADRPCLDCCTYPTVRMRFQHASVYADTVVNFRLQDSVYFDAGGNPYRVADFRFFLSELRLVRPDGSEVQLENRIAARVFRPGGALEPDSIDNDIILVRPPLTTFYDLGTLRAAGAFRSLRFRIGIAGLAASVDPESLPPSHPLRPTASGMSWEEGEGFEFQRVVLLPGDMPEDTTRVTVHMREPVYSQVLELPFFGEFSEGLNVEFDLLIDYKGWLNDISPATQTPETQLEAITARTPNAFSITAIRLVSR